MSTLNTCSTTDTAIDIMNICKTADTVININPDYSQVWDLSAGTRAQIT